MHPVRASGYALVLGVVDHGEGSKGEKKKATRMLIMAQIMTMEGTIERHVTMIMMSLLRARRAHGMYNMPYKTSWMLCLR
jgi:hypothetical protein